MSLVQETLVAGPPTVVYLRVNWEELSEIRVLRVKFIPEGTLRTPVMP